MENLEPDNNFAAPLPKEKTVSIVAAPTPDNPPWNGWTAIGVWFLSVVFIIVLPQIFVLPYMLNQNIGLSDSAQLVDFLKNDPTAIFLQIISIIPAHVFTLILAWFVVTKLRTYSFRQTLGWQWGGFKIWHTIAILIGFYLLAFALTSYFGEQDNDFVRMLQSSRAVVLVVAFMATFTAPIVEEVIYRGILYSAFQRKIGVVWAVVLVTMIFAGVHFLQYWGSPATLIMICLLSLILTLVRVKTGNLLPCIALHTVFNGSQSILLVLQPFIEEAQKKAVEQAFIIFNIFK